jgi:hypothetical protein
MSKKLQQILKEIENGNYKTENNNSTVDDRERRNDLLCSFCRPNKGENQKNYRKHGKGKPKYKNKREV